MRILKENRTTHFSSKPSQSMGMALTIFFIPFPNSLLGQRTGSFDFRSEYSDPGGGYSQKNWIGVCGPLPKNPTLFMTKMCDIPYSIYDLTKNSKPNL